MNDIEQTLKNLASHGRIDDILEFNKLGFTISEETSDILIQYFIEKEEFNNLSRWIDIGYIPNNDIIQNAYDIYIDRLVKGNYFPLTTYMRTIINLYETTKVTPNIPPQIGDIYNKIVDNWRAFYYDNEVEIYGKFSELFGEAPEELWYQEFEDYVKYLKEDIDQHTCRELLRFIHVMSKNTGVTFKLSYEEKEIISLTWGEYGDDIFSFPFEEEQKEFLNSISVSKKKMAHNPDEFINKIRNGDRVYSLKELYSRYDIKPEIYFSDIDERIISEIHDGNFDNTRWFESIIKDEIPWNNIIDNMKRRVTTNGI